MTLREITGTQKVRRKYRNEPVEIDGRRFASKAEGKRYAELRLLERAGEIRDLRCQPRYDLAVNGQKICTYVGDFAYLNRTGTPVTEDVKGYRTDVFEIKAKLFRAVLGREIVIVGKGK